MKTTICPDRLRTNTKKILNGARRLFVFFLQRGEREWPKMYSQLLGSRTANAPEKVVVCSPGLGDRLFNTNVAEKFKGHYYLSSERLYYDVHGKLKSKYFS